MMVMVATIRFFIIGKLTLLSIQILAPAMAIKPNLQWDAPVKQG